MRLILNKPINISLQPKPTNIVDGFTSQSGAWDIIYFIRMENNLPQGQIYRLGKCFDISEESGTYFGGDVMSPHIYPFVTHPTGPGTSPANSWAQTLVGYYQNPIHEWSAAATDCKWIAGIYTGGLGETINGDQIPWIMGATYYYTIKVSNMTAGNFVLWICGEEVQTISANGDYSGFVTPTTYRHWMDPDGPGTFSNNNLWTTYYGISIHNNAAFDGTISEISLQEQFTVNPGQYILHVRPDETAQTPDPEDFIFFGKDNQIGTAGVTGYYAAVEMRNDSIDYSELFAVSSEITQSSK